MSIIIPKRLLSTFSSSLGVSLFFHLLLVLIVIKLNPSSLLTHLKSSQLELVTVTPEKINLAETLRSLPQPTSITLTESTKKEVLENNPSFSKKEEQTLIKKSEPQQKNPSASSKEGKEISGRSLQKSGLSVTKDLKQNFSQTKLMKPSVTGQGSGEALSTDDNGLSKKTSQQTAKTQVKAEKGLESDIGTTIHLSEGLGRKVSYLPPFELPEVLTGQAIRSDLQIAIDVDPEGRVLNAKIEKSSGNDILDRGTLTEVSRYLFEAIPGLQNSHGTISYHFNY